MGMHNFLPSKWIAVIIFPLLCFGIVVGLFFLYKNDVGTHNPSDDSASLQVAAQKINNYIAETDSDNDGLADWEEALWKTDLHNTDTDTDGTPDGREVSAGRDPTRAGPDDLMDKTPTDNAGAGGVGAATAAVHSASSSVTNTIAKELFGSYLALKKANALTDANKQILYSKIGTTISQQINLTPFALKDLAIEETTPKAIALYDTKVGTMLHQYFVVSKTKKNELLLLKEALESKNYTELSTIADDAKIYTDLSLQLRKTPVPKDVAEQHLTLVNAFQVYADMGTAMSRIQTDPIKVVAYLGRYQDMEARMQKALQEAAAYVAAHKPK